MSCEGDRESEASTTAASMRAPAAPVPPSSPSHPPALSAPVCLSFSYLWRTKKKQLLNKEAKIAAKQAKEQQ